MNNCANNKQSKVTEDIIFEVVSNLDTVCKEAIAKRVRDYLKKELGDEEYFRLKELFFHVCVDEYEYKLLVTRRAYLLYHIFWKYLCASQRSGANLDRNLVSLENFTTAIR